MLPVRLRLRVAGQMDLAIFADYGARLVDNNRAVEAALASVLDRQLGIAQIEAHAERLGRVEQRHGLRTRHVALIVAV